MFWAGNIVVGRGMRADIPPVAMAFWRWSIACTIVLAMVGAQLYVKRAVLMRSWRVLLLLGLINIVCFNTMCYIGLRSTTATNGTLLNSAVPIFIIPFAWLILKERVTGLQVVGMLVSLLGVAVVVSQGNLGALAHLSVNVGDAWILAAMILWSFYTVVLRFKPAELGGLAFLGAIILAGLPMLGLLYAWELSTGARFELNTRTAAALAYYGTMPSVLAYLFYNQAVATVGPNRAGIFVHLVPIFGVLLSVTFLGEKPALFHFVGMSLVFVGIYASTRRRA